MVMATKEMNHNHDNDNGGDSLSLSEGSVDDRDQLSNTTTDTCESYTRARALENKLAENGVHGWRLRNPKPVNLLEIQARIASPRLSQASSRFDKEEEYQYFVQNLQGAANKATVMMKVIPLITGREDQETQPSQANIRFNNVEPFSSGIPAAQPDMYYGAHWEAIHERIRDDPNQHCIPNTEDCAPAAPNFFMEVKSKYGNHYEAVIRALHDGAHGARTMHSLQNYGAVETVYDNNAYSLTTTFTDPGNLCIYAVHPTPPTDGTSKPEYFMTLLNTYSMWNDPERFREGLTAFRNARDLTKIFRDGFIDQANRVAAQDPGSKPITTTPKRGRKPSDGPSTFKDDQVDGEASHAKRLRPHPPQDPRSHKSKTAMPRATPASTNNQSQTPTRRSQRRRGGRPRRGD